MKKVIWIVLFGWTGLGITNKASAQTDEITQLLLNVEKLMQFKEILSDMEKGYQILSTGYGTIKSLSEGNFDLHEAFLDGLMQVSPAVKKYRRVADILDDQIRLVKEYKSAFNRFKASGSFTPGEIQYLGGVYNNLIDESLRNLDDLTIILTAGKLRMSDEERLSAIDGIYAKMQDQLTFLRYFNNKTRVLAIQRAKAQNNAEAISRIYGITK